MVGYPVTNHQFFDKETISDITNTNGVMETTKVLVNPMPKQNMIDHFENTHNQLDIYTLGIENTPLAKDYYRIHSNIGANDVVISQTLANQLGAKVSDTLELSTPFASLKSFTVTEIIKMDQSADPIQMAIFNLESLQEWYSLESKTNLLLLKADPTKEMFNIAFEIQNINQGLDVHFISGELVNKNVKSIKLLGQAISIIGIFICAFFIFNSFRMFIQENQKDLALIRAIGGSRKQCFHMMTIKALFVTGVGTLAGLIIDILLSNQLANFIDDRFNLTVIEKSIPWYILSLYCVGASLILLLMVLLPLWKSVNIPLIQTIKQTQQLDFKDYELRKFVGKGVLCVGILLLIFSIWNEDYQAFLSVLGGLMITLSIYSFVPTIIGPIFSFLAPIMGKIFGREVLVTIRYMIPQTKQNTLVILSLSGSLILALTSINLFTQVKIGAEQTIRSEYVSDIVLKSNLGSMTRLDESFANEVLKIEGVTAAIPLSFPDAVDIPVGENDNKRVSYYLADIDSLANEGFINLNENKNSKEDTVVLSDSLADSIKAREGQIIEYSWSESVKTNLIEGKLFIRSVKEKLPSIQPEEESMLIDWENPVLNHERIVLGRLLIKIDSEKKQEVIYGLRQLNERYPEIIWTDLESALKEAEIQLYQRYALLFGILFVISLIGLLNIVTTLNSSVQMHRREYAIFRAISITPTKLIKMIVTQSVMYSLISILVGTFSGIIMSFTVLSGLDAPMTFSFGGYLIMLSLTILFLSILVSLPLAFQLGNRRLSTELTVTS
ncbi:ABC transporter permease [Metabacillus halosaccharovorans]|uniref:ABC transporter permease n=1 Tax=Metabacillus halosaccharovorans TaxID=930124 RepID=A0ABT3DPD6_9BACI|nr:ABC transporter permease [Metabacillus halosaccharovorans]MCV9888691.1 ABC transporter permease [Metabacillus halosaccharovorans]